MKKHPALTTVPDSLSDATAASLRGKIAAFHIDLIRRRLKECDLSQEEKTQTIHLIAGFLSSYESN
jgi:hypothetical protein